MNDYKPFNNKPCNLLGQKPVNAPARTFVKTLAKKAIKQNVPKKIVANEGSDRTNY
jgi:hypothetical protein